MAHDCPVCHLPCHCDGDDVVMDDPETLANCKHYLTGFCEAEREREEWDDDEARDE